jgi:hypothetical protein
MDHAVWQERLAEIERQIVEAEKRVARQREIVAELERGGRRVTAARGLLAAFEELLSMHLADRQWVREELGVNPARPAAMRVVDGASDRRGHAR